MANINPELIQVDDLAHLDYSFLQNHEMKEIAFWINRSLSDLSDILMERVFALTDHDPCPFDITKITVPARTHQLIGGIETEVYRKKNPAKSFKSLCPVIAYAAVTHPETSCHELVFGEKKPVILNKEMEYILNEALKLPSQQYNDLLTGMARHYLEINNATYTLHCRISEIAGRMGCTATSAFSVCKTFSNRPYQIEKVLTHIEPVCNDIGYWRYGYLHYSAFTVALFASIYYNESLDYLLLHDYSDVARLPDRELDENERKFLSAFLYATSEWKAKVYAAILKNKIG